MGRLIRNIKKPCTYIRNIKCDSTFGIENITVEHRSNNPKRDYLFVNKKQCKHIPASPSDMIKMCELLAKEVNNTLANTTKVTDKILVVAFAETATAIGNFVADALCCDAYVLQTTRENIEGSKEIISFEEEHSHATTQKLLTYEDKPINLDDFAYVLFVEDEISTGNTILNFIDAFEKVHNGFKYGVASICNWQNADDTNKFRRRNIDIFALITGELIDKNAKMLSIDEEKTLVQGIDTVRYNEGLTLCNPLGDKELSNNLFKEERLGHFTNLDINKMQDKLKSLLERKNIKSIRVIGTEEFMYIPIKVGAYLESIGYDVLCHSTTRSPIDVLARTTDGEKEASLGLADTIRNKYSIKSVYEIDRKNFIYNVNEHTDLTIIITDHEMSEEVMSSFYDVLNIFTDGIMVWVL